MLDIAVNYVVKAGASIIPITKGEKFPDFSALEQTEGTKAWSYYKQQRPDFPTLKTWFNEEKNIGIVGGKVSNNLCYLDFDNLQAFCQVNYIWILIPTDSCT